jgi:hypothetical protein
LTDNQGAVRFASGTGNDQKFKVFYRADDKADWELILDESAEQGKFASPLRLQPGRRRRLFLPAPGK